MAEIQGSEKQLPAAQPNEGALPEDALENATGGDDIFRHKIARPRAISETPEQN
jgi:hypothetical protein